MVLLPEPALVIVAYDRPAALTRLLRSLGRAHYPVGRPPLVVSIDRSVRAPEMRQIVDAFDWPAPKRVIDHEEHLGLREHTLRCCDLVADLGSIVLLEEDLTVAPDFHEFARRATAFYGVDPRIAGVSLYTYRVHPWAFVGPLSPPFHPVDDGYDTYFLRYSSTWGQCLAPAQWSGFRDWLATRDGEVPRPAPGVPLAVRNWPDSSLKRSFIGYLVDTDRYFAAPRVSLSTNWGDAGTHFPSATERFQVPLLAGPRDWRFAPLDLSRSRYDAYFEIESACLASYNPRLAPFDFECDLRGVKQRPEIRAPYVLTSAAGDAGLLSWGATLDPPELNIVHEIPGEGLRLIRTQELASATDDAGLPRSRHLSFALADASNPVAALQRLLAPSRPRVTGRGGAARPRLIISCRYGLGSRLRAAASAAVIATASQRQLVVVWEPDEHCQAKLEDLLEQTSGGPASSVVVLDSEPDLNGTDYDQYDYMAERSRIDEHSPRDIYVASAFSLECDSTDFERESQWLRENCSIDGKEPRRGQMFRPRPEISSRVLEWIAAYDDCIGVRGALNETIAAHLRTGQTNLRPDAQVSAETQRWRRASGPETFLPEIRRVIARRAGQRFYVAADHPSAYEALIREFGPPNLPASHLFRRDAQWSSRSSEAIADAFIEMLICARTKGLLASNWSAYSEALVRLSGREAAIAGCDFGQP